MANLPTSGPFKNYEERMKSAEEYADTTKNTTPAIKETSGKTMGGGYTHNGLDFSNWDTNDFYEMRNAKYDEERNPGGVNSESNKAKADYYRNKYGFTSDTFSSKDMDEWETYYNAFGDNKYTKVHDDILDGLYTKLETPSSRAAVESAYNDLNNFDYNPENDAMFQAYRDRYLRESAAAQDSTYANLSAFTGGRNNSWASQAVSQVGQSYARKIADIIPTLAESAYNKLLQKYNTAKDMYNTDISEQEREFNRGMSLYDLYKGADADYRANAMAEHTQGQNDRMVESQIKSNEIANNEAERQHQENVKYSEDERIGRNYSLFLDNSYNEQRNRLYEKYGDDQMAAEAYGRYLDNVTKELSNIGISLSNEQAAAYTAKYPELVDLMLQDASSEATIKAWQAVLAQQEATYYTYTL